MLHVHTSTNASINTLPFKNLSGQAFKLIAVAALALAVANCASNPAKRTSKSSEIGAFSDPKYGTPSPRVVAEDESAPKGGGRYQVGKPYTIAGKLYTPKEKPVGYTATGNASWYGIAFHGRKTANGEIYDRNSISAAHPTMPLPSYARVTNLNNNHSIVVRVNDRGPYHGNRVLDVSEKTATLLNFRHMGTTRVKIDYLGQAGLAGSDDTKLVASLRTDGPARIPTNTAPTMVAAAFPAADSTPKTNISNESSNLSAFSSYAGAAPLSNISSGLANTPNTQEVKLTLFPNAPQPPIRPFDLSKIAGNSNFPVRTGEFNAPAKQNLRQSSSMMVLPPSKPTALIMSQSTSIALKN